MTGSYSVVAAGDVAVDCRCTAAAVVAAVTVVLVVVALAAAVATVAAVAVVVALLCFHLVSVGGRHLKTSCTRPPLTTAASQCHATNEGGAGGDRCCRSVATPSATSTPEQLTASCCCSTWGRGMMAPQPANFKCQPLGGTVGFTNCSFFQICVEIQTV